MADSTMAPRPNLGPSPGPNPGEVPGPGYRTSRIGSVRETLAHIRPGDQKINFFSAVLAGLGPRSPSGWPRPVRGFRFQAGSGQIDPSRTRSSHFWPFPGSTDHPFGLQIRGPDHWATARRSRRFAGDRGGTRGWTLGWLAALAGWLGRPCLEEPPQKKDRFFPEKPPWKKGGFFLEKPPLVCV